jgi:hypothetical protein
MLVAVDVAEAPHFAAEDEARMEARPLALRRFDVVEGQLQLGGEGADPVLDRVDELAAVLGGLRGGELAGGSAAAADPVRMGLEERARDAALMQAVGAGEARQAGADDRHAGRGGGRRAVGERVGEGSRTERRRGA